MPHEHLRRAKSHFTLHFVREFCLFSESQSRGIVPGLQSSIGLAQYCLRNPGFFRSRQNGVTSKEGDTAVERDIPCDAIINSKCIDTMVFDIDADSVLDIRYDEPGPFARLRRGNGLLRDLRCAFEIIGCDSVPHIANRLLVSTAKQS